MKTNKHNRTQKTNLSNKLLADKQLADKLRWEDDGGNPSQIRTLLSGRPFVLPMQINIGTFPTPLEWNDNFSIELYRSRAETGLTKKTP